MTLRPDDAPAPGGDPADLFGDASPECQVWRLLCAQTLAEVEPALEGVRGADVAAELSRAEGYRQLDAAAAAYLWLARTQGVSKVLQGA